ncbi:hypothetical protein CPB84DRAFT_1770903 [Gymnopilus junonius]|uniref:Chromatin modification-related protein n=1 Tax=Gymnopilus junonius TaxID=109634 RepID=A0A9P5TRP6_GYMJU|nr:hypothetical protein CPB84DRAFT_1770903 [Gymnopilus junonius]
MSPRERRREQAFTDEDLDNTTIHSDDNSDQRRAEKEQEAWDAIREAHYEAIEQLPLTLHRQLSLMRQLDEQVLSCTESLPPALRRYITQRRVMAGISENDEHAKLQPSSTTPEGDDLAPSPSHSKSLAIGAEKSTPSSPSEGFKVHALSPGPQTASDLARGLLSQVAFMAEELLRASQEKVNLAQANHDSVERHIRLLDQAIKEQEASLSMDHPRSSSGLVIHLPDLAVPKWRTSQAALNDGLDLAAKDNNTSSFGVTHDYAETLQLNTTKRKKGPSNQGKKSTSLTITLPATQLNEELYCYCNRVSFGDMIACDNETCEREWFHLGCVGLTEVPEGEWYCEDCRVDEL